MKIRPFSKPHSASKTVSNQRLDGAQRRQKGKGSSFPEERGSCAWAVSMAKVGVALFCGLRGSREEQKAGGMGL